MLSVRDMIRAEELGFDIVANDLASKEVENVTRALNGLENESEDVQAAFSKMEKELEDARQEKTQTHPTCLLYTSPSPRDS